MNETSLNIGSILRNERNKLGISLDEAAKRTEVSKAMLGQIERGESSPTLSVIWKISTGLKIPLSIFLKPKSAPNYHVNSLEDLNYVLENDGNIKVHTVFPFNPLTPLDYLLVEMQPLNRYSSTTHKNAKEEYVYVISGELTMHVGGYSYELKSGDSMSFAGSEEHEYESKESSVSFISVVLY